MMMVMIQCGDPVVDPVEKLDSYPLISTSFSSMSIIRPHHGLYVTLYITSIYLIKF